MGRTDEAIARACEEILLKADRADEAYDRFALEANRAGTHLATCRALIKDIGSKCQRSSERTASILS